MPIKRGDGFRTTSWDLVLRTAHRDPVQSRRALADLCESYWQPLYAFVRRQGHNAEDARDLTQAFFAHLLETQVLQSLTPGAGRFRSFLLSSLKNMLSDERRRSSALKRGGGRPPISLDLDVAERAYVHEPTACVTPENLYEKRWAATVLQRVLDRLRGQSTRKGKSWEFERLKTYLTAERPVPSYREVAADLEMTEDAVKMAVHRLRERFRTTLRIEIGETVASPEEIDDEIRHLLAALRT